MAKAVKNLWLVHWPHGEVEISTLALTVNRGSIGA